MKSDFKRIVIYGIVSLVLLVFVFMSIDFEGSILSIILHLSLGILLTQSYMLPGLFGPKLQARFWGKDEDAWKSPNAEYNEQLMKTWKILAGTIVMTGLVIGTVASLSSDFTLFNAVWIALYIIPPSLFLFYRKWISLFITTLWIWFPIEWGTIDTHLGNLDFEILPADSLIGLFTLLWPIILYGRHIPWYDWAIGKNDLKYFNISSIAVTVAVVPLGILMYFLKFNLETIREHDGFPNSITLVILVFIAIFVVQGLMEETLFRGIIFKHWFYQLANIEENKQIRYGYLSIASTGVLVASIPFWDSILSAIASTLPFLQWTADRVGSLERELGDYEGAAIPAFEGMPVWWFYLIVALVLTILGFLIFKKYPQPVVAALIASSMVFGFAHFEDWRYVLFASFAGAGYGFTYYKTRNIAASAMVHMGVDAIWSLFLSY